jgi:hypothetical protein
MAVGSSNNWPFACLITIQAMDGTDGSIGSGDSESIAIFMLVLSLNGGYIVVFYVKILYFLPLTIFHNEVFHIQAV